MPEIHPTACVDSSAELSDGVRIGPYCVVGPRVVLGARTALLSHVFIDRNTILGVDNRVSPFACLGGDPQDRKYRGEETGLEIGNGNIIREYVTISRGTLEGGGLTRVGDRVMLMAGAHVAHDCQVGDDVTLANSAALAGHVHLEEHVVLGGLAGIHQFARVGRYGFVAAGAMVSQDVPPFTCVKGDRARLLGLNLEGLRRAGKTPETIAVLQRAYRLLFRSGLTRETALARIAAELPEGPELLSLMEFIGTSQRGLCRHVSAPGVGDPGL